MVTRRKFTCTLIGGGLAGVAAQAFGAGASPGANAQGARDASGLARQLAQIEAQTGGRLGVAILDTAHA